MNTLLIEILTEELPAIPLLKELSNIPKKWQALLEEYKLNSSFEFFYTPRRLVFIHKDFKEKQDDYFKEIYGPPKKIAFDEGKLNKIGTSFLAKNDASKDELLFCMQKNKEVLFLRQNKTGEQSKALLPCMIKAFLSSLNFGKKMRWDDGDYDFIRAIRSLCVMYNDTLIPCKMYGVSSQKATFIHRNISFTLQEFKDLKEYLQVLDKGCVILDQNKRKSKIQADLASLDINVAKDDELLDEVVAITEYPTVLKGEFDKRFLALPSEVIITSMREHQRYFASFDKNKLNNAFVVVSNAVCKDFSKVISGNERVLHARLCDAEFFYENDKKSMLNNDALDKISFLDGLGSLLEKVSRERKIASLLCKSFGFNDTKSQDLAMLYSKADLSSQMVQEFPNLQGVMGYYYALNMGLSKEIATAIKEQYLPNASQMPSNKLSLITALATKLDTLLGLFSVGKIPTGSKDPFALRRAATGVLKILISLDTPFDLSDFLYICKPLYKDFELDLLKDFIYERMYAMYDLNPSFIKAVLASHNKDILSIHKSILALSSLNEAKELDLSVFKRLANIATKSQNKVDSSLFAHESERNLYEAFNKLDSKADELSKMRFLIGLKPKLEDFFTNVMVNDNSKAIKENRHALLYSIYEAFLDMADLKVLSL